jgi:hypothetical protein
MENEIKLLCILYGIFLLISTLTLISVLNVLVVTWTIKFNPLLIAEPTIYCIITFLIIIGLFRKAKWCWYLAFGFSVYQIVAGLLQIKILTLIVHGVIIFYLYKWRYVFTKPL